MQSRVSDDGLYLNLVYAVILFSPLLSYLLFGMHSLDFSSRQLSQVVGYNSGNIHKGVPHSLELQLYPRILRAVGSHHPVVYRIYHIQHELLLSCLKKTPLVPQTH